MNLPQPILRRLSILLFSLLIWTGAHGVAQAQDGGGAGAYVLPYAIVIVCIAGGVYVVTRSSRREEPAKAAPAPAKAAATGSISLTSREGVGTTFVIRLPCQPAATS